MLAIGSHEGAEWFGSISGAVRLTSGVVVVADKARLELRYFSPVGKLLSKSGGRGGGPGEFRTMTPIHRCSGDSVFVYDPALFRMSVFSPEGMYVRTTHVREWTANGIPPFDFWCNSAGVLAFIQRSAEPPPGEGPFRPQVEIFLVRQHDSVVRLGTFPASERYFRDGNAFPRYLGKRTTVAVGSAVLFVGTGDEFAVSRFSLQGVTMGSLRETRTAIPVTNAQISTFIRDFIAAVPKKVSTSGWERYLRALQWPKQYPAFGGLLVDPLDNVWIEEYPVPGASKHNWTIYAKSGARVAVVSLPGNFQLLEVGVDYVLGTWRDALDVEYLRMHSLRK